MHTHICTYIHIYVVFLQECQSVRRTYCFLQHRRSRPIANSPQQPSCGIRRQRTTSADWDRWWPPPFRLPWTICISFAYAQLACARARSLCLMGFTLLSICPLTPPLWRYLEQFAWGLRTLTLSLWHHSLCVANALLLLCSLCPFSHALSVYIVWQIE